MGNSYYNKSDALLIISQFRTLSPLPVILSTGLAEDELATAMQSDTTYNYRTDVSMNISPVALNSSSYTYNSYQVSHFPLIHLNETDKNFTGDNYSDYYGYYYEYDFSSEAYDIPLEEIIPVSLVYGLTLLLGLVGNGLVIFSIVWYKRMRSVTNMFLTSLATADLLLVLICVPIKVGNASYI